MLRLPTRLLHSYQPCSPPAAHEAGVIVSCLWIQDPEQAAAYHDGHGQPAHRSPTRHRPAQVREGSGTTPVDIIQRALGELVIDRCMCGATD
jgi:hypothetical protein